MQDPTATSPQTPIRGTRVPVPNRTESSGIRITTPIPSTASGDQREEQLRQQLLQMQQQIDSLTNSLTTRQNQVAAVTAPQHLSREYWALPIDKSIKYPGEDASSNAKTAYLQRLDAYLAKSTPIWQLVSGELPCPIAADAPALAALKLTFGSLWQFEPKDIKKSLFTLQRDHLDVYDRVLARMNDGSDSVSGSWRQRNAAIYSVVCDTLDLSKNGNDLGFLEIVGEGNGLAIYNLARFRLREIKSSDPLSRAIKLQMGLQHIKYVPKPHGVAKYFARIDAHRSELASLPRPKIIHDWEVTAKTLRELPSLHPIFKSVADVLQIQRKILKTETTLEECRKAFISADVDNDVGGDLHSKNQAKVKRKLRANLSQTYKRPRAHDSRGRKPGKYKFGDCVHHPKSNTHLTSQCTNPFGMRSAFGFAVSYAEKCVAVKNSIAAGWSPTATDVKIPQGYGCDGQQPRVSFTPPSSSGNASQPLLTNSANMPNTGSMINPGDLRAYHRVRALINPSQNGSPLPSGAGYNYNRLPPPTGIMQPLVPNPIIPAQSYGSPVRAYHVSSSYSPSRQHPNGLALPFHQPQPPPYSASPNLSPSPRTHAPAPMQSNFTPLTSDNFPQPTQDDLIAAGMRYYATQTGRQDFQ